jgi:glucose-1-phosphate cytidylyltransferase
MNSKMPVVILCGGMGTRLAEQTEVIPKPLVEIGGRPILWHIMKHYDRYGFREFILALGYKGDKIKRYFLDYYSMGQDFTVTMHDGRVRTINRNRIERWKVHLMDTGLQTQTGGRLGLLQAVIGSRRFLMTYGDGLSDVDLKALVKFHKSRKALATLTAVRPPARFGALEFERDFRIRHFKEKSILHEGWINGGYFVIEPAALRYVQGDVMWEHGPMEQLAADGNLSGYQHNGFWQCMDTARDLRYLESLWESGNPPWKTWDENDR